MAIFRSSGSSLYNFKAESIGPLLILVGQNAGPEFGWALQHACRMHLLQSTVILDMRSPYHAYGRTSKYAWKRAKLDRFTSFSEEMRQQVPEEK